MNSQGIATFRGSKRTGIPVTTIRYYEKVGLLPAPERLESGYRLYNRRHLERINFLKNTRKLGFSQQRIKALVSLLENPNRASEKVKISVQSQLEEIREKRRLIQNIEGQLKQIIAKCDGWDTVEAHMPLAEIHDLIIELRSMSQGAGTYTFEHDHMQELVGRMADQVLEARKAAQEG